MQISLYSAAETVRHLLEQIDETTGELPAEFGDARAVVAAKAQAVAAFILSNEAEARMVGDHAKHLTEKARIAHKKSEWLRQYLHTHMASCGITEIRAEDGTFRVTLLIERDESVLIFDEAQIPADYMKETPAISTPDKKLITKAIHDGYEVAGAKLVKKDRLTIR